MSCLQIDLGLQEFICYLNIFSEWFIKNIFQTKDFVLNAPTTVALSVGNWLLPLCKWSLWSGGNAFAS